MIAAVLIAAAVTGCGKKGPPLPPIIRIPAAVTDLAARRVGNEVYLSMTVPRQNMDASAPASVARIDVYGVTSLTPPPRARFLEIATRVASVPVLRAPDPEDRGEILPPADPKSGAVQGEPIALLDTIAGDELIPKELPVLSDEERPVTTRPGAPVVARPTVPRRFYMVFPIAHNGRPGPPSAIVDVPLMRLPEPPTSVKAELTAAGVSLSWEPSGGLIGWLLDRGLAIEVAPFAQPPTPAPTTSAAAAAAPISADVPLGPTAYNIYREIAPDPLELPPAGGGALPWTLRPPTPINPAPQAALEWSEALPSDERPRCYTVRAVRGTDPARVESEPSERVCVTPVDITPPVTPTNLQALVGEGIITLIWEPNVEEDLGGYIVLRRDAAGDTLQLTPAPTSETRFIDRTVVPGIRYTYEVRAVDSRIPLPNVSAPAEVSETAR